MKTLLRTSLAALRVPRIWLLQIVGNLLLLVLATLWLLVPEARAWHLGATVVLGLVIVVAALWLHAGTLAHFYEPEYNGFRLRPHHLLAFAVWAAVLFYVVSRSHQWSGMQYLYAGYLRSRLGSGARGVIPVEVADRLIRYAFAALAWYLVPALLLPFLAQATRYGFRPTGVRTALRTLGRFSYWVALAPLAVIAATVPQALVDWVHESTLRAEAISMVLRLGAAYLIAVAVWMMAASVLGAAARLVRPRVEQG